MAKYSAETKLEAVKAYLDGVESYKDVTKQYKVDPTMLREWVLRYQEHGYRALLSTCEWRMPI
ncbi:transposase [Baia soyae]|uniref:Transposase n=1 Tax=Baia soyae TaxID=1544746 RepID=A0A4R2RDP4_9BACL|nr:transposase [Baia soyae]TCP60319.1 transposase [Baia soyae]